jgi:ABC-type dipeptide/oligopeptide/nickel transport system permease component
MAGFILRRALATILMIVAMSVFLFGMSRAAGDPRLLYLTEYTTVAEWEAWGREMGLERPLIVQYGTWAGNAVQGDFGLSLQHQRDSMSVVKDRIGATLQLAAAGSLFVIGIAIPLGILSAVRRGSAWDYIGRSIALLGQSTPQFWLGIVLIVVFSVRLGWLPTSGRGDWTHYVLPVIAIGWLSMSGLLRLVRSSMLEVMDSEYIRLARAKGVGRWKVVWKHGLKNALIAPLTFAGIIIAGFIDGSVVVETVFAWPGVGRLGIDAVNNNDFPLMAAIITLITILYVGVSFIVDVLYAVIDPRIRLE